MTWETIPDSNERVGTTNVQLVLYTCRGQGCKEERLGTTGVGT